MTYTIGDIPRVPHKPVVYFLRSGGTIKIGTTTHLRNRLHALRLGTDHVVAVVEGGRELEHALHVRFAPYRVKLDGPAGDGDTEWFEDSGDLSVFLGALTGGEDVRVSAPVPSVPVPDTRTAGQDTGQLDRTPDSRTGHRTWRSHVRSGRPDKRTSCPHCGGQL